MIIRQATIRASSIYFVFAAVVAASAIAYGILNFNSMRSMAAAIADNKATTEALNARLGEAKSAFQRFADAQSEHAKELAVKVEAILPAREEYTELTRQFDNFFAENDRPGNPALLTSLRFGKGEPSAGAEDISMLPVSMNIEGTRDNFMKFLRFVNNSGSLESSARLLEIKSIQLNFPGEGENVSDPKQKLNFTVELNAYYQTPKVERS